MGLNLKIGAKNIIAIIVFLCFLSIEGFSQKDFIAKAELVFNKSDYSLIIIIKYKNSDTIYIPYFDSFNCRLIDTGSFKVIIISRPIDPTYISLDKYSKKKKYYFDLLDYIRNDANGSSQYPLSFVKMEKNDILKIELLKWTFPKENNAIKFILTLYPLSLELQKKYAGKLINAADYNYWRENSNLQRSYYLKTKYHSTPINP